MNENEKRCSKCTEVKTSDQFYKDRADCKGCKCSQVDSNRPTYKHDGVVYFIALDGYVKIGTTTDITQRLWRLKYDTSNHPSIAKVTDGTPKLVLLGITKGGRSKEQEIHQLFEEFRVQGEWFTISPDNTDLIKLLTHGN